MKVRVYVVPVLSVLFLVAVHAQAAPPAAYLQGKYSLAGTRVCVQTPYGVAGDPAPEGFGPGNDYSLLLPATVRTGHYKGTLELFKDGTGTLQIRLMQIFHQAINPGARPFHIFDGTCGVQYAAQQDGTFLMTYQNCTGANTAGGGYPGDSGADFVNLTVTGSDSKDILLLSDTEPSIETVWNLLDGDIWRYEAQRICTRNLTAVRHR